jgi:quercetin dioxygenase-like cupin family protein
MIQSKEFLHQGELITEITGDGVSRQIMGYSDDIMLVKVMFQSGSVGTIHDHPHVQSSYVANGKFEVNIEGEKQILSAGDGFFVPSGKKHGVICLETGILIDAFNPIRKDFLS